VETKGVSAHGLTIPVGDEYRRLALRQPLMVNGKTLPSLFDAREACEVILAMDPVSNGELAFRAFEAEEHKTGLDLTDLAEGLRDVRYTFADIVAQPRRVLTTPTWSALINRPGLFAFTLNVERLIPSAH
jgi:nitrate reductase alpha subunit